MSVAKRAGPWNVAEEGFGMSRDLRQPGYLTLTELVVGTGVFGGVGYLTAGWLGTGCGVALLVGLYVRSVWLAIRTPPGGCQGPGRSAAGPGATPEGGGQ